MSKLSIINYKPEIDCLRGLAVFLVIFFHFELFNFRGGFVGVDVFFVISGYLITSIIIEDIKNSEFSLAEFYARRVRRIIPALYSVIIITLLSGYFILSPQHFNRLGNSSISAAAGYSNFSFWYEAGYFDFEKYFKPLLHTWSLSVELQFYFIWPLLIFIIYKLFKNKIIYFILIIFFSSLILSFIFSERTTGYFYFTIFRLFEFSIGSITYLIRKSIKIKLNDLFFFLGIILIIGSSFGFSDDSIFPGIGALVPCIGSSLILITSKKLLFFRKIFINNAVIFFGKISYSLYLAHWPLIVFYKYLKLEPIENTEKIILILATIILSIFMYRFIELPFRTKTNNSYLISNKIMLLIFISTLFFIIILSTYLVSTNKFLKLSLDKQLVITKLETEKKFIDDIEIKATKSIENEDYFKDMSKSIKVLIWGDSHATDLYAALKINKEFTQLDLELLSYDYFYCFREESPFEKAIESFKNFFLVGNKCKEKINNYSPGYNILKKSDIIILVSRWGQKTDFHKITKFAKNYSSNKIVIFGRKPHFFHIPTLYIKSEKDLNYLSYVNRNKMVENINTEIKKKSKKNNFIFYDIDRLICFDKKCNVMSENNLLVTDEDHWSYQGFIYYGDVLKNNNFLNTIINNTN